MAIIFSEKESVIFVGGRGTKAGDSDAGGGCTKTYWGDLWNPNKVLSDVMGTNGEPISSASAWNGSQTACDLAEGGSSKQRIIEPSSGYFSNCEAGHIANVNSLNDQFPNGRYEVLAVDPSGHWIDIDVAYIEVGADRCDVKVGGAFPTQQEALDDSDAGQFSVNILTNKARDDVSAAIDVDVGGGEAYNYNSWKRVIGIDANGVELPAGSWVEIEVNSDVNCYAIGDVDNIEFRHIFTYCEVGSPTKAGWIDSGTVIHYGVSFVDCKSEGHEYSIEMLSKKRHIQIIGGYFKNVTRVLCLNACYGVTIRGATLENSSAYACIQEYNYIGVLAVDRCIFKKTGSGSGIGMNGWGLVKVTNCVFYDVDDGIYLNYQNNELVEYNNIYYLSSQANSLIINRAAGAIIYSDYSCAWTAAGAPQHADRWGGGSLPPNSIEENPDFLNAPTDFTPQNVNCIYGGRPDRDSNVTEMGAILKMARPTAGFGVN